jgi:hypothetical protein
MGGCFIRRSRRPLIQIKLFFNLPVGSKHVVDAPCRKYQSCAGRSFASGPSHSFRERTGLNIHPVLLRWARTISSKSTTCRREDLSGPLLQRGMQIWLIEDSSSSLNQRGRALQSSNRATRRILDCGQSRWLATHDRGATKGSALHRPTR